MVKCLAAGLVCVLISISTTGCSVRIPDYNPVLGGFAMPNGYLGEALPTSLALANDRSELNPQRVGHDDDIRTSHDQRTSKR